MTLNITPKGHAKACPFCICGGKIPPGLQEWCQTAYSRLRFFGILHKICKKVCILQIAVLYCVGNAKYDLKMQH